MKNVLVIGGAGFIGSHLVNRLLDDPSIEQVTVLDNLSSGTRKHLEQAMVDRRLFFTHADIMEKKWLDLSMARVDTVFMLAANPDIARAVKEPDIDFRQGTVLVNAVLEAMRTAGVKTLFYMSGSGVYGDCGETILKEDMPLKPISTYGASKAACECMISAYCHMFDFNAACFRFANVVGPKQTHGVGYDFIHKLWANPHKLEILGDGSQSKSYIHVSDVINAIFTVPLKGFEVYNVATDDYLSVDKIADMAEEVMEVGPERVYFGGKRGWSGDVPVVRFDSSKIRALGWKPLLGSRMAMVNALVHMRHDMECAT
jgi:UDP-glucose 4-epimerase